MRGEVLVLVRASLALLLLWPNTLSQQVQPPQAANSSVMEVEAMAGGRVLLPCDLEASSLEHPVTQVVFLRKYHTYKSIYKVYAKGGSLTRGSHWVRDRYVDRAFVVTAAQDETGLVLDHVRLEDEAEYRCRVEYQERPARVSIIALRVVVAPKKMVIFRDLDPRSEVPEVAGPYSVGETVSLSCQVTGGVPRPSVTWWEDSLLLDDISEHQSGQVTRNDITLEPLSRIDLHRNLTCRASNANVTRPLSFSVTLDLHYPPRSVRIVGEEGGKVEVRADVKHHLLCQVEGSRPPPTVVWRLNGMVHPGQVKVDGKMTSSTLTVTPTPDQDGSQLTCSAFNPNLTHTTSTASTKLSVLYRPQVEVRRGLSMNFDDIEEGDDVIFRCYVQANPPVTDVEWKHDGEALLTNQTTGVYVDPFSLELKVTRANTGLYGCAASNTEGAATSNTLHLQVKFAPVCAEGQKVVVPATTHAQVVVPCLVDAHPPPTSFRWTLNSTAGELEVPTSQYHWVGMRSELLHTPPAHHYYRRLRCWAANQVGQQRNPCEFYVVPAPKPEAVSECSVAEPGTIDTPVVSVEVRCVAGADGGLSQTFTLEIQASDNVTETQYSNQPVFTIKRVRVGVQYLLTVTAASARGASPPYTFSLLVNDTRIASSSAGQVASPESPDWFHVMLAMSVVLVAGWVVVPACPRLLSGLVLWGLYRRRPPHHTHPYPHVLLNGDPSKEVLLELPPANGSIQPFMRSTPPATPIDVYLEGERSRFLSMGRAPRASLDSLELSTAPPSVYSDPLRSLQPSPFIVGLGPERLALDGEKEDTAVAEVEVGNTA